MNDQRLSVAVCQMEARRRWAGGSVRRVWIAAVVLAARRAPVARPLQSLQA